MIEAEGVFSEGEGEEEPHEEPCFPLEWVEELRILLNVLMKKDVLSALLRLRGELNKEPLYSKQFTWFLRNSQYGGECRYSQAALKKFKVKRLGVLKKLLRDCLEKLEELET